ncbi:hypothetical protein ACHHYP_05198 [Achlya hypogyna]|uniref:Zinc finger ZPR1-type domain-containing protein n=1 Tax=Achlya hypogyna TaxID=1202772 RepID=A0A1V9YYQ3_ACHHY|nr:hypothetical protein ACHHYP_05198 [Achlya hypogyna]
MLEHKECKERRKDRRAILEATKQDIWTIWYAAEHGKVERVQSLLDKRHTHVNAQEPRMQWAALHYAARHAQADVIEVLLAHHANPDIADKHGNTPLHLCAGWGSFRCAVMLLEGGADTQCPNHEHATALDVATAMDQVDIAKLLQRRAKALRIEAYKTPEDRALLAEPEMLFLELRALKSKETTLGPSHPAGIIVTLVKLAKLYRSNLREDEALGALRRAVTISELHYGPQHIKTAVLRNNLAELLYHVQQLAVPSGASAELIEEAVGFLQLALPVIEAESEPSSRTHTNLDYVTCLENLCMCLERSAQHALADEYLHRLLAIYAATYGTSHDKVLRLQQTIAAKYLLQKRFADAFAMLEHCLTVSKDKYGASHVAVAHAYDTLGRGHFVHGTFDEAEAAFKAALKIQRSLYDADDAALQRAHNNVALVALARRSPAIQAPLGGTTTNTAERVHLDIEDGGAEEIFTDINDEVPNVTEIESLCINCHDNGMTKLLLTRIPYFREVILMSFECEHCGFKNSEIQFGGTIQEQGVRMELQVTTREDLNRQLIKSDTASVYFPEIDFEIPAKTQQGSINTIEGLLSKSIEGLRANQDERRLIDPETTQKIDDFLANLALMAAGITLPFTVVVTDPAGNSHIENLCAPNVDPQLAIQHFFRSEAQDLECGLQPDQSHAHDVPSNVPKVLPPRNEGLDAFLTQNNNIAKREAIRFPTQCHACYKDGESMMCVTDIPHFKEVIIMAFNCEHCGFKTNEVKAGGAIPPFGERIVLRVPGDDASFMDRDILKSDSASVSIPELELEMMPGSLGGLYTTLEGLLDKIRDNISAGNPFAVGDSDGGRSGLAKWLERLEELKSGAPFSLVIEDPLSNSFIYSPFGNAEDDPNMTAESYTRSDFENEVLGITDMVTENYSADVVDDLTDSAPTVIQSDKLTMVGGGKALTSEGYHPNPNAVMDLDSGRTEL